MSSGTTPRDEKIGDIKSLLKLKKKYDAPEVSELPESYRTNTEKEKLWLWCANNMQRQIKFDFPHLRPLCVAPENECGVKKLICTFIKVLKIIDKAAIHIVCEKLCVKTVNVFIPIKTCVTPKTSR